MLVKGRPFFTQEPKLSVQIVLHEDRPAAFQQGSYGLAISLAVADSGRVLKVWNTVEKLYGMPGQGVVKHIEINAFFAYGYRVKRGLVHGEGLDSAQIPRFLNDDVVAVIEKGLAEKVHALL
jgi:hypothetical protein